MRAAGIVESFLHEKKNFLMPKYILLRSIASKHAKMTRKETDFLKSVCCKIYNFSQHPLQ